MVSKSLLISVDTTTVADAHEIQLQYSSGDDRSLPSDPEESNAFSTKMLHRKRRSEDSDEEMHSDVNFSIVLNPDTLSPPNVRRYMNPVYRKYGASANEFVDDQTASYLNSEENRERRQARLKRFGGRLPSPLPQVDQVAMSQLYSYFDIDSSSEKSTGKYRLNAIHMRGITDFTTENVFAYFNHYKPRYIEWINDISCNAVWDKRSESAAAMLGLSKPIKLIKGRGRSVASDEEDDKQDLISPLKRSTLRLSNVDQDNDEIMDLDQNDEGLSKKEVESDDTEAQDVVVIDTDEHIVPPTFIWRAGDRPGDHLPQSELILMRFATVDDAKSSKSERESKFYKKHGNPNYGGATGLMSSSNKRRWLRANSGDDFEGSDVRSRLKQRRHEAPLDLRVRLQDASRWNEIRDSTRRWSDDDARDGDLSPYSDLDEPVRKTVAKRVKKPLRMQMRADDVEHKQRLRRRQNAALSGARASDRVALPRDRSDANDGSPKQRSTVRPTDDDCEDASIPEKDVFQNCVNVKDRLKKYRMKITVDNDEAKSTDSSEHSLEDD